MGRVASFLVFFGVLCSLLAGIHYYLWLRLVHDLQAAPPYDGILTGVVLVLFVSIPLTLIAGRLLPREVARIWLRPSYAWLGIMWLLLVSVAAVDLFKGLVFVVGPQHELLAATWPYSLTAAALGSFGALFALSEGYRLRVKRVEVPLLKLPKELDGTTIVQITDVHIGPSIGRDFMERVVATINELDPDVVVITGDLVDGSVENLGDSVAPLSGLKSRYGSYFVTGNHEYYSGAQAWCEFLGTLGVRVLRNEHVRIGVADASFDLAGIDDYHARGAGHGPDLPRALEGRDESRPVVLLAHQPKAVAEAREKGVDLQLSGHTHGGQIWPFHYFVKLQQPVVAGLVKDGDTQLYVSRGTGYWGPPMRLFAPAEVTQIVLRAAS